MPHLRLALALALMLAVLAAPTSARAALPLCKADHWVSGWSAPPAYAVDAAVADATLRMIVTPNTASDTVRLRFSNRYSNAPVTFSRVTVARRASGAGLVGGSSVPLTFAGQQAVTIPAGKDVSSDVLKFDVPVRQALAVSMAISGDPQQVTSHRVARTTSYLTAEGAGDHTGDETAGAFTRTTTSWFYVSGIDVRAPTRVGTVAAIGDSITEGFQGNTAPTQEKLSDLDTNARWPDLFATRINSDRLAVTSAAISGNRVLRDAFTAGMGEALIKRLKADVLRLPGVTDAVLLEGMNDIGQGMPGNPAFPSPTADELIAAYEQVIGRLKTAGIRVQIGTLTPAGGTVVPTYGGEEPNQRRQKVNDWIRSQTLADGVIDFDAALRDPSNPSRLAPQYDSSDHLHPNTAGYKRMAEIVDETRFAGGLCRDSAVRLRFYGRRRAGLTVGATGLDAPRGVFELRRGRRLIARATTRLRAAGTRVAFKPARRTRRLRAGTYTLTLTVAGEQAAKRTLRLRRERTI